MTQIIPIDGFGQLGTRVWDTLAHAPAPRLGAIICVDNGTGGQFYFGVHNASGTLVWATAAEAGIQIESIVSHVLAPGSTPTLTVTTLGDGNLKLDFGIAAGVGIDEVIYHVLAAGAAPTLTATVQPDGNFALDFGLAPGATGAAGISVETVTSHVLTPGSTPTLTATDLPDGNLALNFGLSAGVGIDEVISHTLTPGSTPTLNTTTQPDGNLALDFGIAAGATGPQGAQGTPGIVSLPPLPSPGSSVEFVALVETTGFMFPWVLPAGATIRVNGFQGRWRTDDSGSLFYTDGDGTATGTIGGFPIGALLIENQHLGTNQNGTTFQASDIWHNLYTLDAPGQVILYANTLDPTLNGGYLLCDITVSIPTAHIPCFNWDFIASQSGWSNIAGYTSPYTPGVGWVGQFIGIKLVVPSNCTITAIGCEIQGSGGLFNISTDGSGGAPYLLGTNIAIPENDGTFHSFSSPIAITAGMAICLFANETGVATLQSTDLQFTSEPTPFGASNC